MTTTIITLIAAAFAIWAIVDVSRRQYDSKHRVIWFTLVILVPILGPVFYYFKRDAQLFNGSESTE